MKPFPVALIWRIAVTIATADSAFAEGAQPLSEALVFHTGMDSAESNRIGTSEPSISGRINPAGADLALEPSGVVGPAIRLVTRQRFERAIAFDPGPALSHTMQTRGPPAETEAGHAAPRLPNGANDRGVAPRSNGASDDRLAPQCRTERTTIA